MYDLHVTTYTGNGVYQLERVMTTAYALTHEHLNALESLRRGENIHPAMMTEFERVGVAKNGSLTPMGVEVMGCEAAPLEDDEDRPRDEMWDPTPMYECDYPVLA